MPEQPEPCLRLDKFSGCREARGRWDALREEAESLESTHSCSFDGGGKGRVSNNCIVSLQSVFAVITENWMFLPSPKKRREELRSVRPQ